MPAGLAEHALDYLGLDLGPREGRSDLGARFFRMMRTASGCMPHQSNVFCDWRGGLPHLLSRLSAMRTTHLAEPIPHGVTKLRLAHLCLRCLRVRAAGKPLAPMGLG